MDPQLILNWRRVNNRLTLSRQPDKEAFAALRAAGVTTILNLAPADNKDALPDEGDIVTGLGMTYHYLPVDFENPTEDDFDQFCTHMRDHENDILHVHCIYNARVTAFMLRYAEAGLGGDPEDAHIRMEGIWRPGGIWSAFLGRTSVPLTQPNRYAGYDYPEPTEQETPPS